MTIDSLTAHQNIRHSIHDALRLLNVSFLRGKRVAVKLNDMWASKEHCSGVTQADTLHAVLRHI